MKRIILAVLFAFYFAPFLSSAPNRSQVKTITINGIERTYRLYIPTMYNGVNFVPLLLNFHGKTSSAKEQERYGDFRRIADTANFILVHPQGNTDNLGINTWNVSDGAANPSDVDFISALIDNLLLEFKIDPNKVYLAGLSFGGTMCYKLACVLSEKITAMACVSGSIYFSQLNTCNPTHIMPVMQIHGTEDMTIPFYGNNNFLSMSQIVNYWSEIDNCDTLNPDFFSVPNTITTDGSTAERYVYQNGTNGFVELYKVIGGGHSWPGSQFYIDVTNKDFSASKVIWNFFRKFDLSNLDFENLGIALDQSYEETTSFKPHIINSVVEDLTKVKTSPNPFSSELFIELESVKSTPILSIKNILGQNMDFVNYKNSDKYFNISTSSWKEGVYIVTVNDDKKITHKKIIKK
jgi:polyhydroxybutyrate depolymerase